MVANETVIFDALVYAVAHESEEGYRGYSAVNSRAYFCEVVGCPNKAYAVHLCNAHYLRRRAGKRLDMPLLNRQRSGVCIECDKPTSKNGGWGRCKKHYARRRTEILKITLVRLFGGKCERCGIEYPSQVFDFHHKWNKKFAIGECWGSLRSLAAEAGKCELLCANCHRMETYGGFQTSGSTNVAA